MRNYDIHLNFPGAPVDGPSAGVGIAVAIYSALMGHPVDHTVAAGEFPSGDWSVPSAV